MASQEEVAQFEREHGVGYRYVRAHRGQCPNCGEELIRPRGLESLHDALDGNGYACKTVLPASWPEEATV